MQYFLEGSEGKINLINVLPVYQRKIIQELLEQGKSNEEIAEIWLEANGPANTFPFGTENKKNAFFEKLKIEVEDFICNDEKYIEERKQVIEKYKSSELVGVTTLTACIAPVIGTAPSLILPVVVLILDTVLKMGVNAWCALRIEQRE
ncbi:hypothetical protein FQ085_14940 [Planococcus sp. ANT_H30]|uniref:hypothetical protein n=1 Tax=Planococcus sp. ANT_H30 TaxID=2597347 RepID=UPI0011F07ACF|nr:hypothetical protein [Planococcus sp. ANT_H30]KAA0956137.1 hypothetical protein FQ085_14940 [Planococcus sp. ANT_H30]